MKLRAPFPWFGGKSAVASIVWQRFGDVRNYVEPFAGSLAVLLGRPHWPWEGNRIETVNDADCFLANFWRALQADPEGVAALRLAGKRGGLARAAPVRVNVAREHVERCRTEPEYFDSKIAGWWVWGCCHGSAPAGVTPSSSRSFPTSAVRGWVFTSEPRSFPHLGTVGWGVPVRARSFPLGNAGRVNSMTTSPCSPPDSVAFEYAAAIGRESVGTPTVAQG